MIEYGLLKRLASPVLQETFYPLGFPFRISTNSGLILETARREWACWSPAFDVPPVDLRLEVARGAAVPPPAVFRAHGRLFALVADSENLVVCDTASRSGSGWLTEPAVQDAAYFRYHFLEAAANQFIAWLHLTPIHAACVARDNRGVLLCGPSQAGKSTLAYACARSGFTYVTDDASYMVRCRAAERLIVGDAHRLRLRPEAASLFPELAARVPSMRGNGKLTLEVPTGELSGISAAPAANVHRIVWLRRAAAGPARFGAADGKEFAAWCEQFFYWWDAPVAAEQRANLAELLASARLQALEYSNLDAAVDALVR